MQLPNKSLALFPRGQTRRILLVEEDPEFNLMLMEFLEAQSFRVVSTVNGVDALEAIVAADYDLVLCETMLPRVLAELFYYAVQLLKPSLCERFIFLTSHAEGPHPHEFLNRPGQLILRKPFRLEDLLKTIRALFLRQQEKATPEIAERSKVLSPISATRFSNPAGGL
jgi:DNA-binding response OmpR family regulator